MADPLILNSIRHPVIGTVQPVVLVPSGVLAPVTYRAASASFLPAASATDVFTITGSATKLVRVLRLSVSVSASSLAALSVLIIKRSTANTSGTSAGVTAVPVDSLNIAATATVLQYTANPTLGNTVGNVDSGRFMAGAASASSTCSTMPYIFDFTPRGGQALALRGIAEVLAVNFSSTSLSTGSLNCSVEWTEEAY